MLDLLIVSCASLLAGLIDAIVGGGGKWYRHIRPAPWLAEFWG